MHLKKWEKRNSSTFQKSERLLQKKNENQALECELRSLAGRQARSATSGGTKPLRWPMEQWL